MNSVEPKPNRRGRPVGDLPSAKKYDLQKMARLFKSGRTLEELAKANGVSRERVRQLLLKMNLTGTDGGASVRGMFNKQAQQIHSHISKVKRAEKWGFDNVAEFILHLKQYGGTGTLTSPMHRYMENRRNARRMGLEWNLSFTEWWGLWEEHWEDRGRGKYGMRIIDEKKPYQLGNVEVYKIVGSKRRNSQKNAEGPTLWDDYQRELRSMG